MLSKEGDVGAWVLLCRLNVSSYTLAYVLCMVEGGLGLDGGTRSRVC